MKPKQLIPFIIILLVLGGLVIFQQSKKEKPSIVKQANLASLVPESINKDAVTRIELYAGNANTEKVVLAKEGDSWLVTSNYNAPVTKDLMEKYLDTLLSLKGERRDSATEESKLASYELKDDQAFHVEVFTGADAAAFHLLVGKSPDARSVFLRTADSKDIYVEAKDPRKEAGVTATPSSANDEATPPAAKPTATHWYDKDIIKIEKERIKKVALTMPDKTLLLERVEKPAETPVTPPADPANPDAAATPPVPETTPPAPSYTWQLASGGPGIPLKEPGVDSILQKIATFVASDIVDPAKRAEWGLETPAYKAEITLEGDETIVLEAGRPDTAGDAYVKLASSGKEIIYQVNKMNFERLFAKGNQLFDLPKQSIAQEAISKIQVSGPEGEFILQNEGDWKLVTPTVDMELQTTTINSLLSTLATLAPTDYADAGNDIGPVTHTIAISTTDQVSLLKIAGKCKSTDGYYVQIGDNPMLLAISQNDYAKIALKPNDIFNKKIFDVQVENVLSMDITHEGASFTLSKIGENWIKTNADTSTVPVESKLIEDALFALDEMQIGDVLQDVDPATVNYTSNLTIKFSEGDPLNIKTAMHKDGFMLNTNLRQGYYSVDMMAMTQFVGPIISIRDLTAPAPPSETTTPEAASEISLAPTATPATPQSPTVTPETPTLQAPPAVTIETTTPESAPAN